MSQNYVENTRAMFTAANDGVEFDSLRTAIKEAAKGNLTLDTPEKRKLGTIILQIYFLQLKCRILFPGDVREEIARSNGQGKMIPAHSVENPLAMTFKPEPITFPEHIPIQWQIRGTFSRVNKGVFGATCLHLNKTCNEQCADLTEEEKTVVMESMHIAPEEDATTASVRFAASQLLEQQCSNAQPEKLTHADLVLFTNHTELLLTSKIESKAFEDDDPCTDCGHALAKGYGFGSSITGITLAEAIIKAKKVKENLSDEEVTHIVEQVFKLSELFSRFFINILYNFVGAKNAFSFNHFMEQFMEKSLIISDALTVSLNTPNKAAKEPLRQEKAKRHGCIAHIASLERGLSVYKFNKQVLQSAVLELLTSKS